MSSGLLVFLLGTLGGVLGEALKWYQLRESANYPEYAKRPFYWIITAVMVVAGGVLAWLYGLDPADRLLAVNVGITAPLLLKTLASSAPHATGARSRGLKPARLSVLDFIAGR